MADVLYDQTVRDFLGPLVGDTLVDVTQHDKDEFAEDGRAYVQLHFVSGITLTIWHASGDIEVDDPSTGGRVCFGLADPDDPEATEVGDA